MPVDMVACIADTKASLQLRISTVAEVAHAAEWNCTMQLDTLDEHLRADLAAYQVSLTGDIELQRATISEMRDQIENDLAEVKHESETMMRQKIIPLEQALTAAENSFTLRLNEQSSVQKQISIDADTAINELDARLRDAFFHLQKAVQDLDQHHQTFFLK